MSLDPTIKNLIDNFANQEDMQGYSLLRAVDKEYNHIAAVFNKPGFKFGEVGALDMVKIDSLLLKEANIIKLAEKLDSAIKMAKNTVDSTFLSNAEKVKDALVILKDRKAHSEEETKEEQVHIKQDKKREELPRKNIVSSQPSSQYSSKSDFLGQAENKEHDAVQSRRNTPEASSAVKAVAKTNEVLRKEALRDLAKTGGYHSNVLAEAETMFEENNINLDPQNNPQNFRTELGNMAGIYLEKFFSEGDRDEFIIRDSTASHPIVGDKDEAHVYFTIDKKTSKGRGKNLIRYGQEGWSRVYVMTNEYSPPLSFDEFCKQEGLGVKYKAVPPPHNMAIRDHYSLSAEHLKGRYGIAKPPGGL